MGIEVAAKEATGLSAQLHLLGSPTEALFREEARAIRCVVVEVIRVQQHTPRGRRVANTHLVLADGERVSTVEGRVEELQRVLRELLEDGHGQAATELDQRLRETWVTPESSVYGLMPVISRQVASGTRTRRTQSSTNRSNQTSHTTLPGWNNVPLDVGTPYRRAATDGPLFVSSYLLGVRTSRSHEPFTSDRKLFLVGTQDSPCGSQRRALVPRIVRCYQLNRTWENLS